MHLAPQRMPLPKAFNFCLFPPAQLGALAAEVERCLPWIGHICPPQTSTLASTAHKSASQYWQLAALLRRRRKVQILFPALLSFSRALIEDKATDWRTQPMHNLRFARNCQLHKERDNKIHPFLSECMICSKISVSYFCHQVTTLLLPLQMRSEEPPSASFSQSFISPPPPCLLVPFYPLVRSESRFLFCSSRRLLLLTCLSPCSPSCPFCALLKAASSFPLFLFSSFAPQKTSSSSSWPSYSISHQVPFDFSTPQKFISLIWTTFLHPEVIKNILSPSNHFAPFLQNDICGRNIYPFQKTQVEDCL